MKVQNAVQWVLGVGFSLGLSTSAMAGDLFTVVANVAVTKAGVILANPVGLSLYTFDKDTADVSNCSGGCLTVWPAAVVPAGTEVAGAFGTIQRTDGSLQLTLNHLPLYTYARDKAPGDTLGDGVGGIWHLAHP